MLFALIPSLAACCHDFTRKLERCLFPHGAVDATCRQPRGCIGFRLECDPKIDAICFTTRVGTRTHCNRAPLATVCVSPYMHSKQERLGVWMASYCCCSIYHFPRPIKCSNRSFTLSPGFTNTCRRYCFLRYCRKWGDFESALGYRDGYAGAGEGGGKGDGYSATFGDILALCREDLPLIMLAFVALLLAATSQVGTGTRVV